MIVNYDDYPSTRKEAKELGYKYYYTGKPCKQGHVNLRTTNSGVCYSCTKESSRQYHQTNKEYKNEQVRQWHEANKEHHNELNRQWRRENKECTNRQSRQWRERNPERVKELRAIWKSKNPEKVNAYNAKRRAEKLQATPLWADEELLKSVYEECPEDYELDHIVPLQGDTVCGLHVPENMQYLTPEENNSKNNKFDPDNPEYYVYEDRFCLNYINCKLSFIS